MTDLTSAGTLLVSWVVAPAIVALVAAGIGLGMSRLTGVRLEALTLPTGFLTGMAVMGSLLVLGLKGPLVVAVATVLALAGTLAALAGAGRRPARERVAAWRAAPGRSPATWATLAGLAAYAIAMSPLFGSGRAGIAGYVLNNDSSVHIASIELLRDHGARLLPQDSSIAMIAGQFTSGYPLGAYAWPLVAGVLAGVDAFLVWSPVIAVGSAMTALAAFAIARRLGAGPGLAALGGVVVANAYLPFSFIAQAGAKEVVLAGGLVTTVALVGLALDLGVTVRRALAPAATLAGAIACFGIGSLSSMGPPLLIGGLIGLSRARGRRIRAAAGLVAGAAVALLLAAPAVLASLRFTAATTALTKDPNAVGNLVGAVPWREVFNVWLAGDYRFARPQTAIVTEPGIVLAAALAVIGIVVAVRRRQWSVPLLVTGAAVAAYYVAARYSTYFETKLYVVLGAALAMASIAGVIALVQHPRLRWAGIAGGAVWVVLLAASDAAVYRQAWVTPAARFEELATIDRRFAGQGPILVNEREDYIKHLVRDVKAWESWDVWQPDLGLRVGYAPPAPHTPDWDDYRPGFVAQFPLLLERRRPGGSAPPEGFSVIYETPHYRVWRRTGTPATGRLPLGADAVTGTAALDCSDGEARDFFAAAKSRPLRAAVGTSGIIVLGAPRWDFSPRPEFGPTRDFVFRRGGSATARELLPAGRYRAWIQGQFSPGLRLEAGGRTVGEVHSDLGLFDGWHRLGEVEAPPGGAPLRLVGRSMPPWQAGSRRFDLTGPVAFEPLDAQRRIVTVPASRQRSLCGRTLDWVEYR